MEQFVSTLKVPNRIVAVSADDTKLLPTFRPFLDHEKRAWYIVGAVGGPILVADVEKLGEELGKAQIKKATKVFMILIELW